MTITALFYIGIAIATFAAILALVAMMFRSRRVVCPETGLEVKVDVDPKHAAKAVFIGEHLRVVNCDRWPARRDCDRACEKDIHA